MKKFRCLFLDYDGVVVAGGKRAQRARYYKSMAHHKHDAMGSPWHPDAVAALVHIIDNVPDLQIIISASARVMGLEYHQAGWQLRGYPAVPFATTSWGNDHHVRGKEIQEYLKYERHALFPRKHWDAPAWQESHAKCDIVSYCILDDDPDIFVTQAKHFVRTNDQTGLTMAQARRAVRILLSDKIHGV